MVISYQELIWRSLIPRAERMVFGFGLSICSWGLESLIWSRGISWPSSPCVQDDPYAIWWIARSEDFEQKLWEKKKCQDYKPGLSRYKSRNVYDQLMEKILNSVFVEKEKKEMGLLNKEDTKPTIGCLAASLVACNLLLFLMPS